LDEYKSRKVQEKYSLGFIVEGHSSTRISYLSERSEI
jgi:hypothetical protein